MNTDFVSFFKENKTLLKEYLDLRLQIFRLQAVQLLAESMSFFIWFIVVLFIVFFVLLFLGILFALWIAQLTESNLAGFAAAAGIFILLLLVVIIFRKTLFFNPIGKNIIRAAANQQDEPLED